MYNTGNTVHCYVAAWTGGEFGGKWIHVYVWLSLFAVHLKLSQNFLLIVYTPIQNRKFKKQLKCSISKQWGNTPTYSEYVTFYNATILNLTFSKFTSLKKMIGDNSKLKCKRDI